MRAGRIVLVVGLAAAAQVPAQQAQTPKPETLFRTPWGDPDLQGLWSNATLTPLERPDNVDKEYLTEAEAANVNSNAMERTLAPIKFEVEASGELNEAYMELGQTVRSGRTSLVIDPPNGKVPYTPEGTKRRNLAIAQLLSMVPINSWEDRSLAERCLLTGGLHVPNPFYLNNHQILQTPDHVAIVSEVMNETRIIHLDGRQPPRPGVKLWAGASRGHWEGQTLVVEIANYGNRGGMLQTTPDTRVVERFTRVDATTIDYEATVTDPALYTQPWTLANTLRAIEGPIYEYACHEGNYSLVNILQGARAQDKAKEHKADEQKAP